MVRTPGSYLSYVRKSIAPKGYFISMSTNLGHRSLSRLVSRLDHYSSTYQLIQKLFSEDSLNFDSKGSFRTSSRSIAIYEELMSSEIISTTAIGTYGAGGTSGTNSSRNDGVSAVESSVSDKGSFSELSTFCLQEYN